MRSIIKSAAFLCAISSVSTGAWACESPATICLDENSGFPLIQNGKPLPVVISANANSAVRRAADAFSDDLERVSGSNSELLTSVKQAEGSLVLIGVLGENPLIEELVSQGKLDVDAIRGQWEAYQVAVVDKPWPGVDQALVVVGSDRRGAVFGTFDLSEQMGVSPWYWFADVPTQQQNNVYVTPGSRSDQPKVRYRGIFINDEDPALKGWAQKKFGGVNSGMYEKVFDLLLRLKGNYIWPAMWGKAFHLDDPKNTALADDMGIVMGTSHHEPMTRAHAEWHRKSENPTGGGAWNYETNGESIRKFWRGGIERMMSKKDGTPYESLVTVGMRGDGDEPMSEGTAIELLEQVVADQRDIIADVTEKPAKQTPQVWALYKEVQDYYDKGMTVPDDVTLLFADDNWGLVRRLPTKDVNREGGFGVYYHFDYVGVPRNYKWTNTVQIGKVWQQMNLSYQRGAEDLWVVNVGDLKPIEFPIDFFLTMAWNPEAMDTHALRDYAEQFAAQSFGTELAPKVADLIERYGTYAAMRKPELLNENTFEIGEIAEPKLKGGEFYGHYTKWQRLEQDMIAVKKQINKAQYSAFFQLVEWPIASMSNLYEMYFAAAWNKALVEVGDARSNHFMELVQTNFQRDSDLTDKYHQINDGKWDGMINQVHMNYVTWNDPEEQTMPTVSKIYGGKNNIEVQFEAMDQPENIQVIDASDFDTASNAKGLTWTAVKHLGQSNAGMLALPQGQKPTSVGDNIALSYKFNQPHHGDAHVTLELSPTLDTIARGGVRLAVAVDGKPAKTLSFDLHATGGGQHTPQEKAWAKAVINNKQLLEMTFTELTTGEHELKVFRIDDNMVLEKLIIKSAKTDTPIKQ
ncbi:glycosyl hydrolase 115 family protein [Gilvimarinus sp. SDUM040013]|uniref:Glycosyl hydrolase 115 family protein n=1 Tax=Gilvimarinus gilvus TaxID=3058038 RepID=A0ABU4RV57_9GAMM|nr:glycosyl hydrolase 115 family protein [Gilvimarinus sp. SDUM040013]MDO3387892.1 glycosyl hydrolase 115 family protein [Gilvimarinus sp. SDUM040013]MDX6848737.1 glycosyl hydrolase 115 family protein [Gilvimarinus sp. SDUM040013]